MVKVSVIMPVYNSGEYLYEAMESVINQTLKDIEIICVNDGSTDGSYHVLDEYAKKDTRIKVIHKENSGFGHSMNIGIDNAMGEYIGILEPDDYIDLEMMEKLYKVANENNLDIAKGNFAAFKTTNSKKMIFNKTVVSNDELYNKIIRPTEFDDIFKGNIINPAGIYKKSFINNYRIRHNETPGASYQDLGFWFQLMMYSERMMLIQDTVYYYRQDNPNSSINNKEKVYCICNEFDFIYNLFKDKLELKKYFLSRFQYLRYINYLFAFRRIDERFKLDFLKKMSEDFKVSIDNNMMNYSFFSEKEKEVLNKIIISPEIFLSEQNIILSKLTERIKDCKYAIIYGAGYIGEKTLTLIKDKNREKIIGFAVTTMKNNPQTIENLEVHNIDYYLSKKDDICVIISVSENYHKEIIDLLLKMEYKNVIISPLASGGYYG